MSPFKLNVLAGGTFMDLLWQRPILQTEEGTEENATNLLTPGYTSCDLLNLGIISSIQQIATAEVSSMVILR